MSAWIPWMFMVVASSCLYQVTLKLTSTKLPASIYLMICGAVMVMAGLLIYSIKPEKIDFGSNGWLTVFLVILVGIGTVGIDLGYFYMYKNGAPLALSRIFTNVFFILATMVIGWFLFKEVITTRQMVGIVLSIVSMALIVYK